MVGVGRDGTNAIYRSKGNDSTHLILRGGSNGPNYYEDYVEEAGGIMEANGMNPAIVIDGSHANSGKDYRKQKRVLRTILDQVLWGDKYIRGFMLESNINEGNQKILGDKSTLKYGVSVTDACIGWEETERLLLHGAELMRNTKRGEESIL